MSTNEITGDKQQTKPVTELYRDHYDEIFRKNKWQTSLNTTDAQNAPKEEMTDKETT